MTRRPPLKNPSHIHDQVEDALYFPRLDCPRYSTPAKQRTRKNLLKELMYCGSPSPRRIHHYTQHIKLRLFLDCFLREIRCVHKRPHNGG